MSQRLSKPFWPPALASQAPPAIILAVLHRFRGPALFRGLRTSSRLDAPFWPSGLTRRSSRPAYGGRLTLAVSLHCQLARFSIVGRTSRQSWRHPWMRFLENLFALTVDMRLATQGKFAQNAKIISKMQKKKATPNLSLWELVLQLAR